MREKGGLRDLTEIVRTRSRLLEDLRRFFRERGFLEVETPYLVPYQNPDPNVENVSVLFEDFSGKKHRWYLHTSPEFFMKRLVWAGLGKIFQICRVFRNREVTPLHLIEFTMVEWYHAGKDYTQGMKETLEIAELFLKTLRKKYFSFRGRKVFPVDPEFLSVGEAFRRFAGITDVLDEEEVTFVSGEKDYASGFFRLLVEKVEPALSRYDVPVFLHSYPKAFSMMAKTRNGLSERFELYIAGVEIANGYTELTEFKEYLEKFREKGNSAVDRGFLELLERRSLPECEGVALGFDRLLLVTLGRESIEDVTAFSSKSLLRETASPATS